MKRPNKKMIGIFTFLGIFLFFIIIMFFIGNKFIIRDNELVVMYFRESIQGLKVGSPAIFRGVEIGKVAKIELNINRDTLEFDIPVYVKINKDKILEFNKNYNGKNKNSIIEDLINIGFKAKLATQSFITGQLMIEFDLLPKDEIIYNKNKKNNIFEIPTSLSSKTFLANVLKDLPIKDILKNINILLISINENLPTLTNTTNNILNNINMLVNKGNDSDVDIINNLNRAIYNFNETLKSVKNLTDYLERHPESIIRGK